MFLDENSSNVDSLDLCNIQLFVSNDKNIYQPQKTAELLGSKNVNELISCSFRKVSGFSKRVYSNLFSKSDSNFHK